MAGQERDEKKSLQHVYNAVIHMETSQGTVRQEFISYATERITNLWLATSTCPVSARSKKFIWGESLMPPLEEYFGRIVRFGEVSGDSIIRALFLLGYFRYRYKNDLNQSTIHRLMAAALLCSAKFGEDKPWSNSHIAQFCELTPKQLSSIECEFLFLIEFQVFVPDSQLQLFLKLFLETRPTIMLCHVKYEMAIKMLTPKSFHETCADNHLPKFEHLLKIQPPSQLPSRPTLLSTSETIKNNSPSNQKSTLVLGDLFDAI